MAELLKPFVSSLPGGAVTEYKGIIVLSGGKLAVNINGNVIPARWADPISVAVGDPVLVVISEAARGQGEAIVRARLTEQPRPANATVTTVPVGSPTITVTGSDGTAYIANFAASYTPVVNDAVLLSWSSGRATVVGKVGATPAPPPPPAPVNPPPAPAQTADHTYPATDSSTWTPGLGNWDAWAGGGGQVYQGSYGGYTTYGSWFYSGSPMELAGQTVNSLIFHLGARQGVGNYNQPVTVHFYAHTSNYRPGGDVSRTVGPWDVVIQPFQETDVVLPNTFAAVVIAGGGISIAGEPYAGFNGRWRQTTSGLLTINSTR